MPPGAVPRDTLEDFRNALVALQTELHLLHVEAPGDEVRIAALDAQAERLQAAYDALVAALRAAAPEAPQKRT